MTKKLVYLACPYSHPDEAVRLTRFNAANRMSSVLMQAGVFIFSPISHTHPIALHGLPLGWDFWEPYDRAILETCRAVLVLCCDGWEKSKGVTAEIGIASELGLPVGFIHPECEPEAVRRAKVGGLCG